MKLHCSLSNPPLGKLTIIIIYSIKILRLKTISKIFHHFHHEFSSFIIVVVIFQVD